MEAKQDNFSILMFPWLAHGHIYPYLELAKNLSNKNFNIYFCSTPVILNSIKHDLKNTSYGVSIQLVELHLPSFLDLPPHYHTTKNVPPALMPELLQAFQMSSSDFGNILGSLKPDLLIYDAFQTWAAKHALSLGIPAVHFATTGATAYSFYRHGVHHKNTPFPYEGIYFRDHEIKAMQKMDFSAIKDDNDPDAWFDYFRLSCEIVLMKTGRAIEGKYIDYLSVLTEKKIVPVGSLVTRGYKSEGDDHVEKIMEWLSRKSPFSTVFISFGSENYLSNDQMEEIAKGLEACDVNFIWVVRFPLGESLSTQAALPKGFLDRVKDRGLIVEKWAPQAKILAHKSVGAFVSHCGMSSMIESVYFGVPVIALPLKLDQPMNARLLVKTGVAVEVEQDDDGFFSGKDFADVINKAVVEKTGEDMRVRAAELSEKMRNEDDDAINETAEELRRLCVEYKLKK